MKSLILYPLVIVLLVFTVTGVVIYEIVYETDTVIKPIYRVVTVKIPEVENSLNGTKTPARTYNITVLDRYEEVTVYGKPKGLNINGIEIPNSYVQNEHIINFSYPTGDRNLNEFGDCRKYEVEKGVCEKRLLSDLE